MNTRNQQSINNFPTALLVIAIACFVIFLAAKAFSGNGDQPTQTATGTNITTTSTGIIACSAEVAEVCGSDGNTYRNSCLAEKANITNYTSGKCSETTSTTTGTTTEATTSTGTVGACTREYDPVCGNDGNTYANTCLAENAQVKIVSFGACQPKTTEATNSGATNTTTEATTTPITLNNTTQETPNTTSTGETDTSTGAIALPSDNTDTSSASKLQGYDTAKYHHYQNTSVGYSFAIPKNTSYQGFGAQEWAAHTLAINVGNKELTDFASASVKVYYYTVTPANPPANTKSVTLSNGATVYIASDNSAGTDNIVNTVIASIEKN